MILIVLTWSIARASAAAPVTYPAQVFSAAGVTNLLISGVRGRVVVRGAAGPNYHVRVTHPALRDPDGWGLVVERRGARLVLEVFIAAVGREWQNLLNRAEWPSFDLEVSGPAVPAVIGWREGAVAVADWSAALDLTLLEGRASVTAARSVRAHVGRGTADVSRISGAVDVRGEAGLLRVTDVARDARIEWFGGRVIIDRVGGPLVITGHDAEVDARGGTGAWSIDVPRGRVRVSRPAGKFARNRLPY